MPSYPWKIQQPNLAETFMMAQRAKALQMDIDAKQRAMDELPKIAAAVKAYHQGNGEELQLRNPKLYARLEDRRLAMEDRNLAMEDRERKVKTQKLELLARTVPAIQKNPNAYPVARAHLLETGLFQPEEIPETYNKEQVDQLASMLPQMAGIVQQGKGPQLRDAVEKRAFVNFRAKNPGASPTVALNNPDWGRYVDSAKSELLGMQKAGAGQTVLNVGGGSEATSKTLGSQQEIITQGRTTLALIGELRDLATTPDGKQDYKQFLAYLPKGKAWSLDKLSKLPWDAVPDAAKPQLSKHYEFIATLDTYKAEEYHKLLGGAQTSTEIKNLVNAVLSSDMGSIQFEAAMNALERRTKIVMEIANDINQTGRVAFGTSKFARELDLTVSQRTARERDAAALEMEEAGLSDQEVAKNLYKSGLINKKQYRQYNPGFR